MAHHQPANREPEIQFFQRMIAGKTGERIFLIEAKSSMGKSTLLREFGRLCSKKLIFAPIDLKGSTIGLHEIFHEMCDCASWQHFNAFKNAVSNLGRVKIADNKIFGKADIHVALKSPDEGDRAARRAELTRCFFDDLRQLQKPMLVMFDTYEAASDEMKDWLQNIFLSHAQRTPDMLVIVAGREIPQKGIKWEVCCKRHTLKPVSDPETWHSYATRIGAEVDKNWIAAFCDLFEGNPQAMDNALARYVQGGGL